MIKRILKKTKKEIASKRNRRYVKAIAMESITEGKRLSKIVINKLRKDAPKAKKAIKTEARYFSSKLKKIKR